MDLKEIINIILKNTEIQSMLLVGIVLFMFILFIDLFTTSRRISKKAKLIIKHEGSKLEELENKYSILKTHALSYVNTLGGQGSKELYEINSILSNQADYLSFLSQLISEGDLDEADRVMKERQVSNEDEKWDIRAENLILLIGRKIAKASNSSSHLGLIKDGRKSKRENTQASLVRAKILPKK